MLAAAAVDRDAPAPAPAAGRGARAAAARANIRVGTTETAAAATVGMPALLHPGAGRRAAANAAGPANAADDCESDPDSDFELDEEHDDGNDTADLPALVGVAEWKEDNNFRFSQRTKSGLLPSAGRRMDMGPRSLAYGRIPRVARMPTSACALRSRRGGEG